MVKTYLLVQTGSGSWHFDFQTKNAPSARRLCKILIRVDLLLVQCWTHVANLRRSYALCAARIYTWNVFGQQNCSMSVLNVSVWWHAGLVLPLATLWWQHMMQQSGQACWSRPCMNVVQQRMHLRHAMKGVCTISARFVDSDSDLSLNCSVSVLWVGWQKKIQVYILAAHNT